MAEKSVRIANLVPAVDLTASRERWLVDGLVDALPRLRMRELFALRMEMFREADLITVAVAQPSGAAVGALSSRWLTLDGGERFLHVTTQFVGDGYQHGAVFRPSWSAHLTAVSAGRWGFPPISVLKTYNPVVFCAMRSLSRIPGVGFYPSLDGTAPPAVARLAVRIANAISAGHPFDPATGVISDVGVPPDLYPALPRSTDWVVNRHFARTTRPGDRVLCMLTVPATAVPMVMRSFAPRTASD